VIGSDLDVTASDHHAQNVTACNWLIRRRASSWRVGLGRRPVCPVLSPPMSTQRRVGHHRAPTTRTRAGRHRTPTTRRTPSRPLAGVTLLLGLAALTVSAQRSTTPTATATAATRAAPTSAMSTPRPTTPAAPPPAVLSTVKPTAPPPTPTPGAGASAGAGAVQLATATDIPVSALTAYQNAAVAGVLPRRERHRSPPAHRPSTGRIPHRGHRPPHRHLRNTPESRRAPAVHPRDLATMGPRRRPGHQPSRRSRRPLPLRRQPRPAHHHRTPRSSPVLQPRQLVRHRHPRHLHRLPHRHPRTHLPYPTRNHFLSWSPQRDSRAVGHVMVFSPGTPHPRRICQADWIAFPASTLPSTDRNGPTLAHPDVTPRPGSGPKPGPLRSPR